jgi:hypothetical protein
MRRTWWSLLCLLVTLGFLLGAMHTDRPVAAQAAKGAAEAAPRPVEDDMHEFMEYYFEPAYLRLKAAMASAPADNRGWKAIKGESLALAEGGNLLLLRAPQDEQAAVWRQLSLGVRELGGKLYDAGKKKDFAAARTHYETLLQRCNKCHDAFADGKHQLAP